MTFFKQFVRWLRRLSVVVLVLLTFYFTLMAYHQLKPLPPGISHASPVYQTDNVEFFRDLTHHADDERHVDQEIFDQVERMIERADDFIVIDNFMVNGLVNDPSEDYPQLSDNLVDQLVRKRDANPDMPIVFISDAINSGYGSYPAEWLDRLRDADIDVVISNLTPLRDSTPIYSSLWRMGPQWLGDLGGEWWPNPFLEKGPKFNLGGYLDMFNIKANHRKVVITERTALVASANAHDESGFHENVAFEIDGPIIADLLDAEQAVIDLGDSGIQLPSYTPPEEPATGELSLQYTTERQTLHNVLDTIEQAGEDDELWLAMYYLADREVVNALTDAARRRAQVSLILDPNKKAFGRKKSGLPNRPVVEELMENTDGEVRVRWYDVEVEEFHPKMMMLRQANQSTIISGSTNFTSRNLDNYNLEASLMISGPNDADVMREVDDYFLMLWHNEGGDYTLEADEYQNILSEWQRVLYGVQAYLKLTTY
ncbi:phospholipase D-like domain-containing protein [Halomonas sp. HL-93]|uniref:phospholipase D-like domain-containing protein n=1 Tax=Halomonas sp. HL-93 TaxID=1666906 RepID=UPI0007F0895B|nr:phospholipase D-like domain-containing protein [Halomonas sp. HL-93]SBR47047.1 PLD-like domain-containing protein [Halomonas sp. HL-93]